MDRLPKHQPQWVLLSASADHPIDPNSQPGLFKDRVLIAARQVNQKEPSALSQNIPKKFHMPRFKRLAIIITGELRCITRSGPLLKRLSKCADLFIVTTANSAIEARKLTQERKLLVIEEHEDALLTDSLIPLIQMKQWHKLFIALQLVKQEENSHGWAYNHIIKLRSDYYYAHPEQMISAVIDSLNKTKAGLVGASDKVFAGSRDYMMLFEGFFQALYGWFDQAEHKYWPINLDQVLASDDAIKWYGMNWPIELVGNPSSTEAWREQLIKNRSYLSEALSKFKPTAQTTYHKLFEGHSRFASEVCFARFLNLTGIRFRDCIGLRGFLYSDRNTCP